MRSNCSFEDVIVLTSKKKKEKQMQEIHLLFANSIIAYLQNEFGWPTAK